MTTDIKKLGPPSIPPRNTSQYLNSEIKNIPPITPKRISSRFSGNFEKNNKNNEQTKIEKDTSANTLLESKEFDASTLESEIMNDLNHLSEHFKLSEDKLTLYEEDSDDRKTENLLETNALKSLSSLTINDENNLRENEIQDIPSSDDSSFKSIPDNSYKSLPVEDIEISKKSPEAQQVKEQQKQTAPLQEAIHKKEKSKSKEEKKKLKKEKKISKKEKKSKRKSKNVNNTLDMEQELKSLKERESNQRQFIINEQKKLSDLNQKQQILLQHQCNLTNNQKKQYNTVMQNNDLDQLTALQQQHEKENASLIQNQNILAKQIVAQQQIISDAVDNHNSIVKEIIKYTGESSLEAYALPILNLSQITINSGTSIYSNNTSAQSSPYLSNSKLNSPELESLSPMSPIINDAYYDEGVYSVSGFSVVSGNTSVVSEDVESVLTDQLQQTINRRPTFIKNKSNQKVRIGGADPHTFQKTLNAYRQNAHNATDPALQFQYAKFLIEAANDQYENSSSSSNIKNKNDLFDEGFKFLKKLSNAGYPDAQYYLASSYNQDGEWDKAYPLYVQAAKHNHPIASYEIATYYESKKNYKKASQYYKKSASQGYSLAMYRLGCAALRGEMHMRKDIKNAIKWLKRAAATATKENNGAAAAYELSVLYEDGYPPSIYRDELYSLELLVQAAELDYPPAQYKLGWCFEYGELGCPTDAVQSIHWFLLAAENEEPNAQFSLAGWYLTGAEGVIEPNDKEAFEWAMRAAKQGYVKAEYAVAYFYEMGIGKEKNMKEALHWYAIAAEHGDERAIKRLENESITPRGKQNNNNECKIA